MNEIILNIYLVINNGIVEEFRAVSYEHDGGDNSKVEFLKLHAKADYSNSIYFGAPSDKNGKFMSYNKFYKLEKRGMHIQLFEEIFEKFGVPEHPLICVTPVVDGVIYSQ
ncbi:MAG TPA: hypothetical protein PKA80_12080 [Ignavibacteriaceae bacterium]|nr:hypothetical protein [Ignavibacteriaceae bacterium]